MTLQWKGQALVDKTQWGVLPWEDRILVARGALAVHAAAAAPVLPVEAPTGDLGGAAQAHIREEILTPCPRPPDHHVPTVEFHRRVHALGDALISKPGWGLLATVLQKQHGQLTLDRHTGVAGGWLEV